MSPGPSSYPVGGAKPWAATLKAYIHSIGQHTNVVAVGGATAAGVVDDTTAIHAARDAAGANGALFFPPGTYKTTGLTANVANQTWYLAPGAVIAATGVGHAITVAASGVTIEGPGKVDTGAASAFSGVFISAGLSDVDVLGVEVVNGTYGVRVKGSTGAVATRVRVSGCTIHGTSSHGVFLNWECTDSEISNNQIYSPGGNGIWAGNNSDRLTVIGNHIVSSGRIGIELNNGCPRSVVIGNTINTCTSMGISIDRSDQTKVANNSINATGSYGIELAGSNACVVDGNTINLPATIGISISALTGGTSCDDNLIQGNYLYRPGDNGIYAGGSSQGAKRLQIVGNEVVDAGNGAGSVAAIGNATGIGCTDAVIANNIVRWTLSATSCTGINPNMPNATITGNLIIHDAAMATAGGTAINLPSTALDCCVVGNTVEGNGKCSSGVAINAAVTGLLLAANKITGTTGNLILNNSVSATNHMVGNLCTRSGGAGITPGGATISGNRDTANAFEISAGGHRFDGNIGFYGTTPIAQPAAPTALPAVAPAGGTGTAAGGWDTAAHRDTAIAAINGLITTVSDIKAKLQALGLTL